MKKTPVSCGTDLRNGSPQGRGERGSDRKISEEITAKICPNLIKTINPQHQEVQQILSKSNMKKTTLKHIITKLLRISN